MMLHSRFSEQETRYNLIDPAIKKAGWNLADRTQVWFEVPVEGYDASPQNGITDYCLFRTNGEVLAVIEAKKTRRDARVGKEQVLQYVTRIEKKPEQSFRPFAFMANGDDIYFWDSERYPDRLVAGFFTREDLERLLHLKNNRLPLNEVKIDERIVNRSYQIEAIRRIGETIEKRNKRKALLVMATGTGKTRTTMALIDVFLKARQAQKVLFLADRDSLVGKNGQFRTPRHIIRMMTKLIDPQPGDRICDPAAGTAGFLVSAYEHMLETNTSPDILMYDEENKPHNLIGDKIEPRLHKFLKSQALSGYDFDATMVRIGAMNLMLHGVDNPHFRYADALSKQFNEKQCYDVILANPPFKGSIDESDINERFMVKTKKTELLFVELIYDLLDSGGRAAVIVPDGVLFGTSNAHVGVRKLIVDKCRLNGIISMPSGVFKPYAGVSTAVLLFTKGDPEKDYDVWFYDMQADGFSLDDKRQKIAANNIDDIKAKYPGKKKGERVVIVNTKEIRSNKYDLSISRYKPVEHKAVEYEKPEVLMDKILVLEEEIADYVRTIKKEI